MEVKNKKVYVVLRDGEPEFASKDKLKAHVYAENKYGSKQDGICVSGVEVRSYTDLNN